MRYFTVQDNRRLLKSALAAFILHAAVFIGLSIFIAVSAGAPEERIGMITINLESGLPPGPKGPAGAFQGEGEKPPAPTPKAEEPKAPAPKNVVAAVDKSKPKGDAAAPVKAGSTKMTKDTAPAKDDPDAKVKLASSRLPATGDGTGDEKPVKETEPPSQLKEGSLSQLDAALAGSSGGGSSDGSGGGGGGRGGSNTSTRWEDNAARELLSQTAPVIPKWVSEQGLRLKVELSVELSPEGFVLIRGTKTSSGYPDVDAAVAKAVSRWKYSRGAGTKSVKGTITYFIELK